MKCYRSQGGETFARYYDGDWTKPEDPNWSHSQADLSVCRRLAFFCRGDMEQMDRLFRDSGLYREKWDERRGDGTYGELTMRKAIAGCTAFYDPKPNAADDFVPDGDEDEQDSADRNGSSDDEDDACTGTDDDNAALIDEYLSRKTLSVEDVIAPAFLELASWANTEDVARYVAIRKKIPRELGLRRFEAELRKYTLGKMAEEMPTASVLQLSGCQTRGMIVPQNWIVDDHGIRHMETVFGELQPVTVCRDPLFVSAKVINVDDNTEKLGITYRRNGAYKTLIASRADLLNKNTIIKYADFGLPVSSGTAGTITKYVAEMEAANDHVIPITNTRKLATVTVIKNVTGTDSDKDAEYSFTATGLTAAQDTFKLHGRQVPETVEEGTSPTQENTKVYTNIPYGTVFSVTEDSTYTDFDTTIVISNEETPVTTPPLDDGGYYCGR